MSKVKAYTTELIKDAAEIIKKGGLVAFPTETVYGIGASAFNPEAIARIFEVKQRPRFDPLIVHISDYKDVKNLVQRVDKTVEILIKKFWPGPLTLVLKKSDIVPDIVTAGLNTVAIRMPANPIALELIRESEVPIAAPSANIFGRLSPTTAQHVFAQIGKKIDLIIDGGRTRIGVESTVLDLTDEPTILRPGGLPLEEIEKVLGKVKISPFNKRPRSPGQLLKHYAPRVPLKIIKQDNGLYIPEGLRVGFLAFKSLQRNLPFAAVEILSTTGDLKEAAAKFFSSLHRLEDADIDIIYAEPVPEQGLGRAIMDRLRKAEGLKNE
jgi:L-threonylcarbamoyladenylate synthase